MGQQNFILVYVQACVSGGLPFSECGAVWQLAVITGLLVLAIALLAVLRWRSRPPQ